MNFFGHAAVAGRFSERPAFLLGAMLPDFCAMLGLRGPAVASPGVAEGVRFHHQTDGAFHDHPLFCDWCRQARSYLDRRGVARGTARAASHVGLELLIDAALAEDTAARKAYVTGLSAGADAALLDELCWPLEPRRRLLELVALLERRVVAKVPALAITERLERALAGRPRLAIAPRDQSAVADWVELVRGDVVTYTPTLVAELVAELERHRAS